jgi:NADPH:quinone reductase-like Zn-dependent oxidoreductase
MHSHISSASVGAYTIQLARIYSIPVVTVCSPKHFDLCKKLGATHVFDYHDPDVVAKIKSAAPNIEHVFDCIGSETSSPTASQAVTEKGGILCTVRPGKVFTEKVESRVKVTDVLVWTVFLKDHQYKEFKWPVC